MSAMKIIELVESETEQVRSRVLCEAAIRQVAGEAERRQDSARAAQALVRRDSMGIVRTDVGQEA